MTIKMAGRIPHDLRRSGIKHYVEAGVPPQVVMRWSGHRTMSTLLRYAIIDLDDLRRAGKKASDYQGQPTAVRLFPAPETRTGPVPAQAPAKSRGRRKAAVELRAS
ncbi:MAG: hypothetical protein E6I48_14050 [Chloroflexi bacterium]|nr:MAG: hypothetical protein E6I48_14050 [Chloroflexota bacterium]